MKLFAATVMTLSLLASASSQTSGQTGQPGAAPGTGNAMSGSVQDSQTIKITRAGSQPSRQGPVANFTGSVRVDPLFQANGPARASASLVTFEPGARTAWHSHPLGQILIVTAGTGRVQRWGDPVDEIHQGDVVWIPPGVKHWHGAGPNGSMAHIGIVEQLDGKSVEWMEKVSDAQYGTPGPRSRPGGPRAERAARSEERRVGKEC